MILTVVGGGLAALLGTTALIGVGSSFMFRRVVPANMVHTVQTKKKTISYGKGKEAGNVYWAIPSFVPFVGVSVAEYPVSVFPINLKGYEAYDKNKVPFQIDVVAFFQISDSDTAVQNISSFEELKAQLTAVLQGAVRTVLANFDIERIMQDRAVFGESFTTAVNNDLNIGWGVQTVKSIEFMDIRDTDGNNTIANIMAKEKSRIEKESRIQVAENRREAELKEIEARRVVDVSKQDAEQQVGIRTAEKEKEVGIAQELSSQEVLTQARETVEREMQVRQVNEVKGAQIAQEVAIVNAEARKQTDIITAEAKKQTDIIAAEAQKAADITRANATKETTELVALGQLAAAKNEAEGIQAKGEATAKAEEALLLAPVTAQITLAQEIGDNPGYQNYLVTTREIEKQEKIGIEMAAAYKAADIKVIANGGNVPEGVNSLSTLLSPQGGTALAGMLSGFAQTPEGQAVINKVTGVKNSPKQP